MPAKTHGMSRTRIYYMWKNMKGRCTRESCDRWLRYGVLGRKNVKTGKDEEVIEIINRLTGDDK